MSRKSTLPEPWRSLADKLGGVGKLAEAMGVDPRTIGRWAHGERAFDGPQKILFEIICRENGINQGETKC